MRKDCGDAAEMVRKDCNTAEMQQKRCGKTTGVVRTLCGQNAEHGRECTPAPLKRSKFTNFFLFPSTTASLVGDRLSSHSSMRLRHKTSHGSSPCPPHNRDNPLST